MNFVEIITKLFGSKAQKDMRAIQPVVDQIKAEYEKSTSCPTMNCVRIHGH